MGHGGKREGSGRRRGGKNTGTLAKIEAREHARIRITRALDVLLDAALERAKGLSYLVTRDAKTGKFIRVTRETLTSLTTAIEVWQKEPDIQAIRELLDRALDKPKEQAFDVNVAVDWDKRVARMRAARARIGKK